MSTKDKYHDTVVRALQKAGWQVLGEQEGFIIENRRIWIDIRVSKEMPVHIMLVEVKNYENVVSPVAYLESTLGQYLLYRAIIMNSKRNEELYLALPEQAMKGIFGEAMGKLALKFYSLKVIVFNIEREEIVEWITN